KAFANVMPPAAGAPGEVAAAEAEFTALGRPTQFAAGVLLPLPAQYFFEAVAHRVSQAGPDEVKNLVIEDARELAAADQQRRVEDHVPVRKKAGRVPV